jgi:pimeloyl-ACP methyl ester carboxylesterase
LISFAVLGLSNLSVSAQDRPLLGSSVPNCKQLDGKRIVFVINGELGSNQATDGVIALNGDLGLGLTVMTISWSRNDNRYQDMADTEAQLCAAAKLAGLTAAVRRDCPNAKVFYVGHSSGARIALVAAEMSPPQSIDRLVLLNAAVSSCYDLRKALQAIRCGIDNFYASEDRVLETAGEQYRLADCTKGMAAGRNGFRLPPGLKDIDYCRYLRQTPWQMDYHGQGDHCTWIRPINMKRVLPPIFCANCCEAAAPVPARIEP